jgi:hypothetical protein
LLLHIPVSVYNGFLVIWGILVAANVFPIKYFLFVGLPIFILANLLYIVLSIVAAVYAKRGRFIYLPIFGRIAFRKFYIDLLKKKRLIVNTPPKGLN